MPFVVPDACTLPRPGRSLGCCGCERTVSGNREQLMATTAARIKPFRPTGRSTPRPLAGRWRDAARIGFGGFVLAMAAYNTTMVLPDAAEAYRGVAELSWPGFDWLMLHLVVPAAVPFTVLLIAFEVGVAVLVLSKGRWVRVGLLAAMAFMIGLAPLMSWYELANLPLVAGALALLARDYDRSLLDVAAHSALPTTALPGRRPLGACGSPEAPPRPGHRPRRP
jgi:hypothetical protein